MQDRFTLRFTDGERQGDSVPITSPRFTLGRRPGNTFQLQDNSVSGQHAEFVMDGQDVLLRDLGSTNGTRLNGAKLEEGRPAHGDVVTFGSVSAVFEDSEISSMPVTQRAKQPSPATDGATPSAGDAVERISAEMLARSSKKSKTPLIVGVVLLLGGGAAAAYFLTGKGSEGRRKFAPVVSIAGNKIPGGAFEGAGIPANWSSSESAPALFSQRGSARASGRVGMQATLIGGEWARLESDAVGVSSGRAVELRAHLRANGDVSGRAGIEFFRPAVEGEEPVTHLAWTAWVSDVSAHQEVTVAGVVPVGTTQARVVVEARAAAGGEELGGDVDVDDVSLTDSSAPTSPAGKVAEYAMWLYGEPQAGAHLTKINRSLIAELRGAGSDGRREYPLVVTTQANGFELTASGAGELHLRLESSLRDGGVATLSHAGLTERGVDFEAQDVLSLLFGSGHELVAMSFEQPVKVVSGRDGLASRIRIEHGGQRFRVQVDFTAERALAGDLAFAARNAERSGQLGECLANWNEMLEIAPHDATLVQEARTARARLEQAGLIELARVERSFEQAKFFRLINLFRKCRQEAGVVGSKYAGSAVETQAQALIGQVDQSLLGLEADLSSDEVERLKSIARVLELTASPRLAKEVRSYLSSEFGEEN